MSSEPAITAACSSVSLSGERCTLPSGHAEIHMASLGGGRVVYWEDQDLGLVARSDYLRRIRREHGDSVMFAVASGMTLARALELGATARRRLAKLTELTRLSEEAPGGYR